MKILLPTDSSACSQAAIEATKHMQYGVNDELKVITVIDLFEPLLAVDQSKAMEKSNVIVQRIVEEIRAKLPDTNVSGEVFVGYPDQVIIQNAVNFKADLIVMGSHGRTGLTRFLWGSVSRAVLLDSPCAVRIVRTNSTLASSNNRVLVALDESQNGKDCSYILQHILKASWPSGTSFHCISVLDEEYKYMFFDPTLASGLAAQREETLLEVSHALQAHVEELSAVFGKACVTSEIMHGDPRMTILEKAKDWHADIIVTGTHARRGIDEIVMGSVADAISSHAPCSVEIVRQGIRKAKPAHIII
jgi:nucleotide-binding universal stress UspA family protein